MRNMLLSGALAAAVLAWTPGARADDDAEKAKADAQHDVQKAKADAANEKAEAQRDASRKEANADAKVSEARKDAHEKVSDAEKKDARATHEQHNDRMATFGQKAGDDRAGHRTVFDGKDNFEVKGRIQQVGKNELTVARDDLPAVKLHVEGGTKIELNGDRASFASLRQGQDVKASFNLRGDRPIAVEIKADAKR